MIKLENIYKSFHKETVIANLNLEIEEGKSQVLLGFSGSGKTTTLKLINGLIKPDSGQVYFDGQTIESQSILDIRRKMGYVIQQSGLFPHYTVFENIAAVPRLLKWSDEKIGKRVHLLMERLLLNPDVFAQKYPAQLSGGQAQRVGLARALAADPPVLLMDEPFGALDPVTRISIRREFLNLEELKEKTIVIVTHDVQEAFELGDKVAIIHEGKVVQNDSPANILESPNEFTLNFIKDQWLSLSLKESSLYDSLNEGLLNKRWKLDALKSLLP